MRFIFMWNGFSQPLRMIAGSGGFLVWAPVLPLVSFLWSINDLWGLCSSLLSLADPALSFGSPVPVLLHLYSISVGFPLLGGCALPGRVFWWFWELVRHILLPPLEALPWKDSCFYIQFSSSLIRLLHFPLRIWGDLGALLFSSPSGASLPLCFLSHRPRSHVGLGASAAVIFFVSLSQTGHYLWDSCCWIGNGGRTIVSLLLPGTSEILLTRETFFILVSQLGSCWTMCQTANQHKDRPKDKNFQKRLLFDPESRLI